LPGEIGVSNAIVFEMRDKKVVPTSIDKIDFDTLGAERFAWLDLDAIVEDELRPLVLGLGIPGAEVEELLDPEREYFARHHQRYVVSKVPVCLLEGSRLVLVPVVVVMTPSVILTARGGPLAAMNKVYQAYRESFESLGKSPAFIYFLFWDAIVDGFLPNILHVDDELEDVEEEYMRGKVGTGILDRISTCKRKVQALKRSLAPMQRFMRHLAGSRLELVSDESRAYLGNLFDHMERLSQSIDSLQDRVHSALEGYNSILTQQQNNALKVLTIIATIMMPLSLIAAIYGMNFEFMPELRARYGYFVVLGVMVALGCAMLVVFKKKRWL
jgi:magnesium transporter